MTLSLPPIFEFSNIILKELLILIFALLHILIIIVICVCTYWCLLADLNLVGWLGIVNFIVIRIVL